MASSQARRFPTIKKIRTFVIEGVGSGGDYHNVPTPLHLDCSSVDTGSPADQHNGVSRSREAIGSSIAP